MAKQTYLVLRHREIPNIDDLDVYIQHGGFETFRKMVETKRDPMEIVEIVKASGLRGRGGAGFPTGLKWSFLNRKRLPSYVVCNSDESEPGTFKDREIMEKNPFQFLEGLMITAYANQAHVAYNYLRGEYWPIAHHLDQKIAQLHERGFLGKNLFGTDYHLEVHNHLGAGAYICGEESALLNSMEGVLGQPRLKPPFPADRGLYGRPTIVNNTETLTNVPLIVANGAEWYRSFGTEKSAGTKVMCLSGHVANPGNYEFPFGVTFREVIEAAGGVAGGKQLKAILPSGASAPILPATDAVLDCALTYEDVARVGSSLGSASIILMDETTDIAWVTLKTMRFFKHESCGKCTPCREGTYWMKAILERVNRDQAAKADIELLNTVANQIVGKCLCPLGDFSTSAVTSGIKLFQSDYLNHTTDGKPKAAAPRKPAPAAAQKQPIPAGD